jgi:hypothetical protein
VCRVLRQLWEYRESMPQYSENDSSAQLKSKFFALIDRLETASEAGIAWRMPEVTTISRKVVMISSTALDLPKHREQARLACEQAGFAPHDMMEHLTARNADAIEASLHMVEHADVYVGLFAQR